MASTTQELKHRTKDDEPIITAEDDDDKMDNVNAASKNRPASKRTSMAKRGVRSLSVGISVPVALTLANILLFGWSHGYRAQQKAFWIPPLWALHLTCVSSAFIMGLSAWLVWAEGGFHRMPSAVGLYLAQLGLSLAWDPIFFSMGAPWAGLAVCLAQMATLVSCARMFGRVNPIAGDLVKLCLAWAGFLTFVNLYFLV